MQQYFISIISTGVGSRRAYFGGFRIVAVSFIAEFSFRFEEKQLFKVEFIVYYAMTKCIIVNKYGALC